MNLLVTSCEVDGARYNVEGEYCYRAFSHGVDANGESLWHGHPIPWSRLPTEAKIQLIEKGRLSNIVYRKAIRRSLGMEFGR